MRQIMNMSTRKLTPLLISITLLITTIVLTGCNEGDSLPEPISTDNMTGIYEFTQFEFVPNDTSMASVNMLDTLIALTELKLSADDRFVLSYHFDGGVQRTIGGILKVNTGDVRLDMESGNEEALASLLLGDLITLKREDTQLRASIPATIDSTSVFNPYAGLPLTGGTLELRLKPRTAL